MAKAALVSKIMYPESLDGDSAQNQLELWIIAYNKRNRYPFQSLYTISCVDIVIESHSKLQPLSQ